jgi:hypothetical protein
MVTLGLILGSVNKDTIRFEEDVHVFKTSARCFWVQEVDVRQGEKVQETESVDRIRRRGSN